MEVGNAWIYERVELNTPDEKSPSVIHFKSDFITQGGELTITNRHPAVDSSGLIISAYSRMPPDSCIADVLTGIVILRSERCRENIEPGETWENPETTRKNVIVKLAFRYVGRESVTVPAGTFETYRFDCDNRAITPQGEVRIERTYWYAPEVRGMVAMQDADLRNPDKPRRWRMQLREFTAR